MQEHDEDRFFRRIAYTVGGAIVIGAATLLFRYIIFDHQVSSVTKAVNDIQANATKAARQMQEKAAAAQRAAAERAAQERQAKVDAERQRIAAQQAAVIAANQAAAAKEAAWNRFYRPSKACEPYDARGTMECANEYARAKKAFEQQWAAAGSR